MNNHDTITQFPKSAIERLPFPNSKKALEDAIEVLIALSDILEPDPELEDNGDNEPSLGWVGNGQQGNSDDREHDESDDEPSLASPEHRDRQIGWASGGSSDLEDDGDDEPNGDLEHTCGWFEKYGQANDIAVANGQHYFIVTGGDEDE